MSHLLVRAACIAGAGLGVSWLLLAGNSPLSSFLVGQPLITNFASAINLPTTLFALGGFPGRAAPTDLAVALVAAGQWLAYGLAAAWVWRKLWPNNSSKPTPLRGAA
ncbi:hypothetical protein GCM10027188_28860 [Lysobacter humi (ex Lee et al. 2017)]